MKRFLSISLLFIYSLAFSGMVVKMHFCGGSLESWNINKSDDIACCCEPQTNSTTDGFHKTPSSDDCCSNQSLTLKVADEYSNNSINTLWNTLGECLDLFPTNNLFFSEARIPVAFQKTVYYGHAPPIGLWQDLPLYLLQSKFLIYDVIA